MKRIFAVLILSVLSLPAFAALEITITGGQVKPLSIAIVPFQVDEIDAVDTDAARVVESDLKGSGLFAPFPREDMISTPSSEEQVQYGDWRALGVEHVVIGVIRRGSMGNWIVEFRLLNVARGTRTLGFEIPVSASGLRYAAHQISDLIYENLTGHKGVFNTRIAYITAEGPVEQREFKLMIADADGYDPKQLVRSSDPLMSPAWSPDGRQMAFVAFENGQSSIYVQTVATGVVRKVSSQRGINGAPAFAPDGKSLAVTLSYEGNPEIYVIDLATGAARRLTHDPSIDTEPSYSPDGKHIVFTSDRAGRPQIYRVKASGGEAERLTFEGRSNARASYSPDGKFLALVHQNESGFKIAALNIGTRDLRVLGDGPLDESPSFAPNSIVIIYSAKGRGGAELATVAIDTGIRQSLRQTGDVREPAWSPFHH